jgi:hypothetical protein
MKLIKGIKNPSRKKTVTDLMAKTAPEPVVRTSNGHGNQTASGNQSGGSQTVTIEAKIDVGFGNALYLRGEGEGLNWNQGIPLTCVDGTTWQWSGKASDKVKFKLLLNDQVWAQGEDVVAAPGQKIRISPAF